MYFKKSILALAVVGALQGCGWDEKYDIVDCTADADSSVTDCRSAGEETQVTDGETGIIDSDGNIISFERDASVLQALTGTASESWLPTHLEELDLLVKATEDQVLVASKFHNYLRAFQSDNAGQLVAMGETAFLDVSGGRYAIDAVTGASEQVFNGLDIDTNGDQTLLIAQAEKYDDASKSTGVGLYVEPLQGLDALPERDFASGNSDNFISYGSIRASTVSPDGVNLALTGSDRKVLVYATGHYTEQTSSQTLGIRGSSISYSIHGENLYVGGLALSGAVVALNTESLSESWMINVADKPLTLLPETSGGVIALLSSGNSAYWLPKNGDESAIVNIPLANQAAGADINSDGNILVVADTDHGVEAISLVTGNRARVVHGDAIRSLAIDGFGTIWVLSQGELQGYRLPDGFK